eukprot:3387819-Pyramimonas_sp.AAC.2
MQACRSGCGCKCRPGCVGACTFRGVKKKLPSQRSTSPRSGVTLTRQPLSALRSTCASVADTSGVRPQSGGKERKSFASFAAPCGGEGILYRLPAVKEVRTVTVTVTVSDCECECECD